MDAQGNKILISAFPKSTLYLPNLLPRNAYLSEIARFADEIVKKLTEEQGSGLRHDRLAIRTVDKAKVVRLRDLAEA